MKGYVQYADLYVTHLWQSGGPARQQRNFVC